MIKQFLYFSLISIFFFSCDLGGGNVFNTPEILPCDIEDMVLTNWNPDGVDYLVDCEVQLRGTLEIKEGTTIEFTSEGGMEVSQNGRIEAIGLGGQPIVMRGTREGSSTWKGLFINTDETTSIFEYVEFSGGGNGPNFSLFSNEFATIYLQGNLRMNNCNISDTDGTAIWTLDELYQSNILEFSDNTIENCGYFPLLLTAKALTNMDLPSCSFIENGDNAIAITEEGNVMDSEFSFVDAGIPYYFLGGLIIKNNVRIEAGVEMQMRAGSSIAVENSSALLTISGSQTNRVSISGKLNNAGFWKGIYLSSNQNHVFENLDISDGGSSAIGFNSQLANITLEFDAKLTMINCTSSRPNSSCDVLVHNFGGNPVFTDESDDLSVCTE